jgi:hypothetical protein
MKLLSILFHRYLTQVSEISPTLDNVYIVNLQGKNIFIILKKKLLSMMQNLFRNCYGIRTENLSCLSTIHIATPVMSHQL